MTVDDRTQTQTENKYQNQYRNQEALLPTAAYSSDIALTAARLVSNDACNSPIAHMNRSDNETLTVSTIAQLDRPDTITDENLFCVGTEAEAEAEVTDLVSNVMTAPILKKQITIEGFVTIAGFHN